MFRNYLASSKDLDAIGEALSYIQHPKLNFVFIDRTKIKKTVIVSFDSKFLYLWSQKYIQDFQALKSKLKDYFLYKLPHKLEIKKDWQDAWCAGLWDIKIEEVLPDKIRKENQFETPRVSGGLLTPFIELQAKKANNNWPYTTKESYLATIIHEFGHVYWNQHKLWWMSNKQRNLSYLKLAKKLYKNENTKIKEPLSNSTPNYWGEVFAYCTEYFASEVFFPNHKKALDKYALSRLNGLINKEERKNLEKEDSVIEPSINSHDFAFVLGKTIITLYPKRWVKILTSGLHLDSFVQSPA